MITGSLKNKVNAIWQDFYNENMAQTSDIVNQLTTLMFIKMLDDKQSAVEAQASVIGVNPNQKDLIFKDGIYQNIEKYVDSEGNERKHINFEIPYENMRWKNFKNLNSMDLAKTIKNYVIPYIKDPNNSSIGQFGKYAKKYSFGFDDKERLLTSVVDKLSDSEFDFTNIDLMGDVYEYMCGSGISGQFRTPRHIIEMAVKMMKPKLGETIIDPAMGTAGFIIEASRYVKHAQKKELLNVQNNLKFNDEMFYGADNDPNMARIGYMNAILHGIKNPTFTMDSLLENENAKDYIGKFDLVLANPPFSGSLVESATNGKVLSITKTKKTELLFVALMVMLLKVGGRCMTVVPDGVLFGTGTAHKRLRIELIEKQKLVGVVSLPSGIFSAPAKKGSASKGSEVKTSFIIFEKTNNGGTDNVWFYDMKNDGFSFGSKRTLIEENDIPDIIKRFNNLENEKFNSRTQQSFLVPVDEIRKNDYELTFNKYKKTEKTVTNYRNVNFIIDDLKNIQKDIIKDMENLEKIIGAK